VPEGFDNNIMNNITGTETLVTSVNSFNTAIGDITHIYEDNITYTRDDAGNIVPIGT